VSSIPDGLQYTKEHEWVTCSGTLYTMGITDFAQAALGDLSSMFNCLKLAKH